jgi:hypothetical protein
MAAIDGSQRIIGIKVATTLDTPTAIGTNDKIEGGSFSGSEGTEELIPGAVGSGASMQNGSDLGAQLPAATFTGVPMRFGGADLVALAQMHGTATVSGPDANSIYHHSILWNATANAKYLTLADKITTASVAQYTTVITTDCTINIPQVPGYVTCDYNFLANEVDYASVTNTVATIANATITDTDRVVAQLASTFRINTQAGGALASGDIKNITSLSVTLSRPQEFVREMKGSAGLGAPRTTGEFPIIIGVTVTFRNLEDAAWVRDHQSGKEFKADWKVLGGSNANKFVEQSIPRMKIVEAPSMDGSSAGNNAHTVSFKVLEATASPTGMIDTRPYLRVCNTRSTGFLA